jgi:hypothetical protein
MNGTRTIMLEFKNLEASHMVVVNGKPFAITEADIDTVWWSTVDLIDLDHVGPAPITLGSQVVVLEQEDWESLYQQTNRYIENYFTITDIEVALVYH